MRESEDGGREGDEGEALVAVGAALKGHTGTIRVMQFQPSSSSSASASASTAGSSASASCLLASAGAGDFKPRLWDVSAGESVKCLLNASSGFSFATFFSDHTFHTQSFNHLLFSDKLFL